MQTENEKEVMYRTPVQWRGLRSTAHHIPLSHGRYDNSDQPDPRNYIRDDESYPEDNGLELNPRR